MVEHQISPEALRISLRRVTPRSQILAVSPSLRHDAEGQRLRRCRAIILAKHAALKIEACKMTLVAVIVDRWEQYRIE